MIQPYDYQTFTGVGGLDFVQYDFRGQTIFVGIRAVPDAVLQFSYDGTNFGEDIQFITAQRIMVPFCCRSLKIKQRLGPNNYVITGYF